MKGKKSKEYKRTGLKKWIENRRKRNQRKYIMTKPSFKKIFAKYLAVFLCMAMLVCMIGTYVAVGYYRQVMYREFVINTEGIGETISNGYTECMKGNVLEEEAVSRWKSEVRWQLNSKKIWDYEACLYDKATKEPFVEQKCVINVILIENPDTEDKVRMILECDFNRMEQAVLEFNNYWEEIDSDGDGFFEENAPWLELKDLYVKGGHFVPGKLQLLIMDENGETQIIKEYDYTPEDTTGYQFVDLENDKNYKMLGPVWFVESDEDVSYDMIKEYVKNGGSFEEIETIWNGEYSEDSYTFWGMKTIFSELVTLDNGKEYVLVMAGDINLWKNYGGWVIASYIGILLLAVVIAIAFAYRTYMVRLNHYQLDTYRRETTNAMAHDLKTPLTAISGYAENLRNNVHSEKKDYYADIILEHVQYMNEMVGNILELAKVENTNWMPHKESLDLKAETQDILKKYEILTADKNLTVSVEGERVIEADKVRMTQALENLIGNAMKYAANDTIIHIKLEKDFYEVRNRIDGELEVSVEELWKPFIKGDNSRNEERGTGVGLTIVKNIADVHGFELVLQCEEQEFVAKIIF